MAGVMFSDKESSSPSFLARTKMRYYAYRRTLFLWRSFLATEGKPQFFLGVTILCVIFVTIVQMFLYAPFISEDEEIRQNTFASFQRSRAEWTPPEVWWNHVPIASNQHGSPDTFFRLRLMILTDDSHTNKLQRLLTSLVSAHYNNLVIPIDIYITVHAPSAEATEANHHNQSSRANEAEHSQLIQLLNSFAWIHGRYDIQFRSVGDDESSPQKKQQQLLSTPPDGGKSDSGSHTNTDSSRSSVLPERMPALHELWFPTSCWELGMFLDHNTVLAPRWFDHVLSVIRSGLADKGMYEKFKLYNLGKFRQDQKRYNRLGRDSIDDILAYVNQQDGILGFSLSDFHPEEVGSQTVLTTRKSPASHGPGTESQEETSRTTSIVDETTSCVDTNDPSSNNDWHATSHDSKQHRSCVPQAKPYLLQRPGGFGTIYLPYAWRQVLLWAHQKRFHPEVPKEKPYSHTAAAPPQWQVLLHYMNTTNTFILYPGMPRSAQIAKTYPPETSATQKSTHPTTNSAKLRMEDLEAVDSKLSLMSFPSMDKLAKYNYEGRSIAGTGKKKYMRQADGKRR